MPCLFPFLHLLPLVDGSHLHCPWTAPASKVLQIFEARLMASTLFARAKAAIGRSETSGSEPEKPQLYGFASGLDSFRHSPTRCASTSNSKWNRILTQNA